MSSRRHRSGIFKGKRERKLGPGRVVERILPNPECALVQGMDLAVEAVDIPRLDRRSQKVGKAGAAGHSAVEAPGLTATLIPAIVMTGGLGFGSILGTQGCFFLKSRRIARHLGRDGESHQKGHPKQGDVNGSFNGHNLMRFGFGRLHL